MLLLLPFRLFLFHPISKDLGEGTKNLPILVFLDLRLCAFFAPGIFLFVFRGGISPFANPLTFGPLAGICPDAAGPEFIFGLYIQLWGSFMPTRIPHHLLLFSIGID